MNNLSPQRSDHIFCTPFHPMAATSHAQPSRRRRGILFTSIHERNINSVRLLVDTVLPVRYSEDFFKECIRMPSDFTMMGACSSGHCARVSVCTRLSHTAASVEMLPPTPFSLSLPALCSLFQPTMTTFS